jgi:hypothetical protein
MASPLLTPPCFGKGKPAQGFVCSDCELYSLCAAVVKRNTILKKIVEICDKALTEG